MGLGVGWGWRELVAPLFSLFFVVLLCFSSFILLFSLFFFVFLRLSPHSPRTKANNCNLLEMGNFTATHLHRP